MSTRTIEQTICDRSGRFIEAREAGSVCPDVFVAVPWIPTLGDIVEADEGGARAQAAEASAVPGLAIFDDLGDRDRLTVAKIIARLLKIDEAKIIAEAVARDGGPLVDALDLGSAEAEPAP